VFFFLKHKITNFRGLLFEKFKQLHNKILDNGKQKGRTNDKYQKITHFNIE